MEKIILALYLLLPCPLPLLRSCTLALELDPPSQATTSTSTVAGLKEGSMEASSYRPECGCSSLELTTDDRRTNRLQLAALGEYQLVEGVREAGWPVWRHVRSDLLLYRSNHSSAWAVGQSLGSKSIRLDNRGQGCPHQVTVAWRVAAGSQGMLEDASLRARCPSWPCGREVCGHNARCDVQTGRCACTPGTEGDPQQRCFPQIASLCNCRQIELDTQQPAALANQQASFGTYFLFGSSGGYPVYQHQSGLLFLYQQDGSWLISNEVGSRAGGIQNQGDPSMCPYRFKTAWEYADISLPGWQWSYDYSASMVCSADPCSITKCGQRATCTPQGSEASCSCDIGYDGNPYSRCFPVEVPAACPCTEVLLASSGQAAVTQSDKMGRYFLFGYFGGQPVYQHQSGQEYLFQAQGQAWAIGATPGGLRVGVIAFSNTSCPYKVEAGWQHSTRGKLDVDPGLTVTCRVNSVVQNPVTKATPSPTTSTTTTTTTKATQSDILVNSWLTEQHKDQQGKKTYLEGTRLMNFVERGSFEEQLRELDEASLAGEEGWQKESWLETLESGVAAERRVNSAIQALEELEAAQGQLEVLEAAEGQLERPGQQDGGGGDWQRAVTESQQPMLAVQELEERPTPSGILEPWKEERQEGFDDRLSGNHVNEADDQELGESIQLHFYSTPANPNRVYAIQREKTKQPALLPTVVPRQQTRPTRRSFLQTQAATLKTTSPNLNRLMHDFKTKQQNINPATQQPQTTTRADFNSMLNALKANQQKINVLKRMNQRNRNSVTQAPHTATTANFNSILNALKTSQQDFIPATQRPGSGSGSLHPAYTSQAISTSTQRLEQGQLEQRVVQKQLNSPNPTPVVSELCNCSTILITSNNPVTMAKHSAELGQYRLAGELSGRPVYRHTRGGFYLYYQQESGGNWLVNTEPGLLYGGLQNSKDFPVCPYLVSTVWQYGDSEVGGWVYDPSLQVTCPSHPCSVVKCGFRATCSVQGGRAQCGCRSGYMGDPYSRCYPRPSDSCSCRTLTVDSRGASRQHQRDKMGTFHLWGYYNNHPVYQHYSGLDFLYFHKNQVWGIGPKVGGKRAGLLNFSAATCPYQMTTPWQFGTKDPHTGRQIDTHLNVTCRD